MAAIGEDLQRTGGPPTEAQTAAVARAQRNLEVAGRVDLVILTLAAISMAVARYVV